MDDPNADEVSQLVVSAQSGRLSESATHFVRIYVALNHVAYAIQELEECIRTGDIEPSTGPERKEIVRMIKDGVLAIMAEARRAAE